MKYESAEMVDMEVASDAIDYKVNSNSLENISTQKLNEYFELIQLKQQHPEFAEDINAQLLSFTNDNESIFNYENEFTISNIQQIGNRKAISDSVDVFTLKYTVTTGSRVFQDSVMAYVTSGTDYLQTVEAMSIKKVRFERFE